MSEGQSKVEEIFEQMMSLTMPEYQELLEKITENAMLHKQNIERYTQK